MGADSRTVVSADGSRGTLLEGGDADRVLIDFAGSRLRFPRELISEDSDGTLRLDLRLPDPDERVLVPIVEEQIRTGTTTIRERVTVSKSTDERSEEIDIPLEHEQIEIRRVPVEREVDSPPAIRTEGDTTIVPVLEERLVIQKRIVLKEEIHLTRVRTRERHRETVALRSERAEVSRSLVGRDGHVNE